MLSIIFFQISLVARFHLLGACYSYLFIALYDDVLLRSLVGVPPALTDVGSEAVFSYFFVRPSYGMFDDITKIQQSRGQFARFFLISIYKHNEVLVLLLFLRIAAEEIRQGNVDEWFIPPRYLSGKKKKIDNCVYVSGFFPSFVFLLFFSGFYLCRRLEYVAALLVDQSIMKSI